MGNAPDGGDQRGVGAVAPIAARNPRFLRAGLAGAAAYGGHGAAGEEFLCRGILLDAARAKGGAAYGLLFSALFFGVIHFYPAAVVNAFVMGLLLGFIYIRSNSLYIVVILHAFNNALAMLLLTLGYAHTTLYELMSAHGLKMLYTVVYGVSLGIFLVAGYMVWKTIARLREQEQAAAEAQ